MRGYILAAGVGARLRPLTLRTPKPLLPLGERRLIEYAIESMRDAGVRDVSVNTHHLGEQIHTFLGDGSRWGVKITISHEVELLGTGGGLGTMYVNDGEPCLVANADVVAEIDWKHVLEVHHEARAAATMVLRLNDDPQAFASIDVNEQGDVTRIGEGATGPLMFTGLQVLEPQAVKLLPKGRVACSIADMYRPLIANGQRVHAYISRGYWADLGTPERYAQAQQEINV